MKKLVVEREEGIAELIERVIADKDDEISVVVPKGSLIGRSVSNFHLLKREAEAADKSLTVESVDDNILAFAKTSGLPASHPLWHGVRGTGGMSDIVPVTTSEDDEEASATSDDEEEEEPEPKPVRGKKKKTDAVRIAIPEDEDGMDEQEAAAAINIRREDREVEEKEDRFLGNKPNSKFAPRNMNEDEEEEEDNDDDEGSSAGSRRLTWIGAAIVIVGLAALAVVTFIFGHVAVAINFTQTPWTYQNNFVADKSVSSVNGSTNTIPAQVFTSQKNTTQTFPASGSANVSLKAQGTLTIFNAYSSASQDLVATTRFVTPDGKIFRLVSNVTVPGAQINGGQVVPSSIDVTVAADQAGPSYNEGPVAKLTIPGFAGSPKADGFYGQLKTGTTGGFTGTRPVPTAADITNAKTKTQAALQANLSSDLTTSYPNNFKILDGATNVAIVKLTVSTTTDSSGNFSVFGEATLQAIGFDESVLRSYLLSLAQSTEASSTFSSITINYSNVTPNFTKGTVSFAVSAQGTLEPAFSADDFKSQIAGVSLANARGVIAGLPQLSDGKISVWPMWLWSIPSNPSKINVTAN